MLQRIIGWCKKMIKVGVQWVENKLLQQTRPSRITVVVGTAADVVRTRAELIAENALLGQQLVVLRRSVKRPKLTNTDRRLLVVLGHWVHRWRDALQSSSRIRCWSGIASYSSWSGGTSQRSHPENHCWPMRRLPSSRKWRARTSVGARKESAASCSSSAFTSVNAPSRNTCARCVQRDRPVRPGRLFYTMNSLRLFRRQ